MKNRPFDEAVLRRIQGENLSIRQEIEMKIRKDVQMKRTLSAQQAIRRPMRMAILIAAVLLLIFGAALATVHWSSRSLITHQDEQGQEQVNEVLLQHVQPIGQSFQGTALDIDVVDAIFDGNALVLAWTLTNRGEEPVYLYCDIQVNDDHPDMGSYSAVDEVFVHPGETLESGFSARVDGSAYGASTEGCDVRMQFTAFASNGEVVQIGAMEGEGADDDFVAYNAHINTLIAEGKVPIAPDGVIEMGDNAPYAPGMTRAECLEASGLMRKVDTVDAAFSIARNAEVKSALPEGTPVEQDNGGYLLRVTQADLTPNAATFRLERVFADQAAVDQFSAYYSEKLGPYWGFSFLDETGDIWWSSNSGGGSDTDAPEAQADGRCWVWGYTAVMTNLERMPQTITIVPYRDDVETGETNVAFPEEALTLSFQ